MTPNQVEFHVSRALVAAILSLTLPLVAPPADAALVSGPWAPIGGQAGAAFGSSVAPAGDVNGDGYGDALVGAPLFDNGQADEGRAFLYLGSANGLATSAVWTWEPNQAGAHAGALVAPAGDVNRDGYADLLIGAPEWDEPGHVDAGAVFVFYGSSTGPGASPNVTLSNQVTDSRFGSSACTAGDVNADQYADVVVGAPRFANGQANEGAVYVFHGSVGGLATVAAFTLEGDEVDARTGASVSTAGDVNGDSFADIVFGAPGSSPAAIPAAGKAIVLPGSGTGILGTPLITIAGLADSVATGASVSLAGDINGDGYADIVVGSPGLNGAGARRGAVVVYVGQVSGVNASAYLTVPGQLDQGRFGSAVATAGDVDGDGYADVLLGAERFPSLGAATGQALVYAGGRAGLVLQATLSGSDVGARFGAAVATAGDFDGDGAAEVLVGAPDFGTVGLLLEGQVRSWIGKVQRPSTAVNSPLVSITPGTQFGGSVAIVPQVDSDAFPSILVGEPAFNTPVAFAGRVSQYHSQIGSIKPTAARTFPATTSDGQFGELVADAGDVDRDTWSDFIIASPEFTGTGQPQSRGRVVLYRGASSGPVLSSWVAEGDQVNEVFGTSIAARGDINGDGYHDVLVGTPYWDSPTLQDCGKVWFYPGSASGLGAATWTAEGTVADQEFGAAISIAGDLDADGYSDVAISTVPAPAAIGAGPSRVSVYYGGPTGLPASPAYSIVPTPPEPSFGLVVTGVGDVDGDAVSDLAVGVPAGINPGEVFLYRGNKARSQPMSPFAIYSGADPLYGTGRSIAGGGDLNGDGIADIVLGEPGFSNGQDGEGRLLVFLGRPNLPRVMVPDTTYESNVVGASLGGSIAPLADVSYDTFADIVAGASNQPAVYVFLGGGEGIARRLHQTESGFGGLYRWSPALLNNVALFGVSQDSRSAAGRDRVAADVEVELQGNPFTGVSNRSSLGYIDTQAPTPPWGSVTGYSFSQTAPWTATTSRWRARTLSRSPYFPRSRWVTPEARVTGEYDFRTGGTNVDAGIGPLAGRARIERVAPNPASATSTISFVLGECADVRLDVYDVRGRHVRELARGEYPAGLTSRTWDGADALGHAVSPGIYFVEFRTGSTTDRSRIVRLP